MLYPIPAVLGVKAGSRPWQVAWQDHTERQTTVCARFQSCGPLMDFGRKVEQMMRSHTDTWRDIERHIAFYHPVKKSSYDFSMLYCLPMWLGIYMYNFNFYFSILWKPTYVASSAICHKHNDNALFTFFPPKWKIASAKSTVNPRAPCKPYPSVSKYHSETNKDWHLWHFKHVAVNSPRLTKERYMF